MQGKKNYKALLKCFSYCYKSWYSNATVLPIHIWQYISLILLSQMRKKTRAVVSGCIMVRMDATLLLSLETKSAVFQPPESLSPGPITMETTELLGTCPVSLGKVNSGCTGCQACRDTEGVRNNMFANVTYNPALHWEIHPQMYTVLKSTYWH